MEKKPKRPGKRDYLNDFGRDLAGNYNYTGKVLRYGPGQQPFAKAMLSLWGLSALMLAAGLICCSVPAAGANNTFYVVLPAGIGFVGAASVVWAMVRLHRGGPDLRAYLHKQTVEALPMRSGVVTLCSGCGLVGEALYLALHGFGGKVYGSLLFLALQGAALWASITFRRRLGALRWE